MSIYADLDFNTATGTSTWKPPTKEECRKEIIFWATYLTELKWYQGKGYGMSQLKFYCDELKKLN